MLEHVAIHVHLRIVNASITSEEEKTLYDRSVSIGGMQTRAGA